MTDEREIRKETGFFGGEKEIIYVNGQKVGEIKSEERGGFLGIGAETVKVEYNTKGEEVGYTKQEERGGFLGIGTEEVQVRYDTRGEEIGHSRVEEKGGFLGIGTHHVRVEYDTDGNEVGQTNWEKRGGFLGIGAERVRVTRYKDGKPPSIVADSGSGSSSESDGSGSGAVVSVLIVIAALWLYGSNTKTNKQPVNSNPFPAIPTHNSPQQEPEMLYVNTQQMKLRGSPGVQYNEIGKISYGDAVVATETTVSTDGENWVKVKTGNLEGWLNRKFLSPTQPVLDGLNTLSVIIGDKCDCGSHGGSFDATYNGKSITVSVSYNVTEANPVSHPLVISQNGHVTNDFSLLPCQTGENKCPSAGSIVQITGNWTGTNDFEARQLDFSKESVQAAQ